MKKKKTGTQPATAAAGSQLAPVTPRLLRRFALPQPDEEGGKEERGRVLIIGGSPGMPGAVILAATAALRAGAGKLQIAVGRQIAPHVATAVPEARVIALDETKTGALATTAATQLSTELAAAHAVLVGPGMIEDAAANSRLMIRLLTRIEGAILVLDAAAMLFLAQSPHSLRPLQGRAVLTPHAGEMLKLTNLEQAELDADPLTVLRRTVEELSAVITLKGRTTLIAGPAHKQIYCNRAGNVGLGISGSGDVLAGIIAGLAARGAAPLQATLWGVSLHARAGDQLAREVGPLGYLPREVPALIPRLMAKLEKRKK